MSGDCETKMRQ